MEITPLIIDPIAKVCIILLTLDIKLFTMPNASNIDNIIKIKLRIEYFELFINTYPRFNLNNFLFLAFPAD